MATKLSLLNAGAPWAGETYCPAGDFVEKGGVVSTHRSRFTYLLLFFSAMEWALAQKLDSNWTSLFNGKDLSNWYAYIAPPGKGAQRYENPADDPGKNYQIINNEIVFIADTKLNQTMGYLGTDSTFSRYHFRVEYKLGPNCAKGVTYCKNSGLLYHMVQDGIFGTGIECNMYWDWPTATAGLGGVQFTKARSNFGNFQAEADSMNKYTVVGDWNVMEIIVWGDSAARHYVNGHLGGWVEGIKLSSGSPLTKGHIALQIEGNDVSFRNPQIRNLDQRIDTLGCTNRNSSNYNPHATKEDGSCKVVGLVRKDLARKSIHGVAKPLALRKINGGLRDRTK